MSKLTKDAAMAQVRGFLTLHYSDYWDLPNGERVLLAMAVLANDEKVREVGGNNSGPWVGAILEAVDLPQGYSWCAAAVEFSSQVAKSDNGPGERPAAGVINWIDWAKANDRWSEDGAGRGRLCAVHSGGESHMGDVAEVMGNGTIRSYEGNTSSGEAGSQQDGQGEYCRIRSSDFWDGYIDID